MRPILLDRDGVINENLASHVTSWHQVRFVAGSLEAIRLLSVAGFPIYVITNQAIVHRGLIEPPQLDAIHEHMLGEIRRHGGEIKAIRYCPHRPDEQCSCRKPRPGMLLQLAEEFRLDYTGAYLIGDARSDIAAGRAVGCRTIGVLTGRGSAEFLDGRDESCHPDHLVADLLSAARLVINDEHLSITSLHHDRVSAHVSPAAMPSE